MKPGSRSVGLRPAKGSAVGVAQSLAMGFLKRLLGGAGAGSADPTTSDPDPVDIDAAERARDLELARAEQDRLDELSQRQLRYAAYAWQPPRQGGERRADDDDKSPDRD